MQENCCSMFLCTCIMPVQDFLQRRNPGTRFLIDSCVQNGRNIQHTLVLVTSLFELSIYYLLAGRAREMLAIAFYKL